MTATINNNNGIDQHLQNDIFNNLCILQYNDGMQNAINNLTYSGKINSYHNDKKTFLLIESGIENTAFVRHSVCVDFMLEHTYTLLQLMDKSTFNKYKKNLHLILVYDETYYYHIETANIYAIMYTLITEKILHTCLCDDCTSNDDNDDNDGNDGNEQPATSNTATVAAGNNESDV